jgi:BASS family bile acid:Na+ symporter
LESAEPSAAATIVLAAALVVIMTSLGLGLTVDDFKRVVVYPKGVGIGLANLVLISPVLAFAIAELFGLPAALAVGVVLLGASPGGAMANMLTHLARGDVALSISMTAISSVCAVITVPLFLSLAVERFGSGFDTEIEMLPIVGRVFALTLVPLSIGMWLRARRAGWTARNYEGFRRAALGFFVVAVIVAVVSEHDRVLDNFADVAGATIALNVIAMTLSFTIAKAARLSDPQATAIAMELGIHNATLAIAVAATIDIELAIPAAVYSSFMFVSAGLFARAIYRRNSAVSGAALEAPEEA